MIEEEGNDYARLIGGSLRAIRRQRGWSLREAENASGSEFSASALGTYERGERSLSVERLHRLARLYRVPVDRLLPEEPTRPADAEDTAAAPPEEVVIDLSALEGQRDDAEVDA